MALPYEDWVDVDPFMSKVTGLDAAVSKATVAIGVVKGELPFYPDFGLTDSLYALPDVTLEMDIKDRLSMVGIEAESFEVDGRTVRILGRLVQ